MKIYTTSLYIPTWISNLWQTFHYLAADIVLIQCYSLCTKKKTTIHTQKVLKTFINITCKFCVGIHHIHSYPLYSIHTPFNKVDLLKPCVCMKVRLINRKNFYKSLLNNTTIVFFSEHTYCMSYFKYNTKVQNF